MRVVFTRQPSQAGLMEAGLTQAGYPVEFCPVTDFVLDDVDGIKQLITRLDHGEFSWLLLTSPNTIRALKKSGWNPAALPESTTVAVTGAGTARLLPEGLQIWMPQDASAAGILAEIPQGDQRNLALPQSAAAGAAMRQGLRERNWLVTHVSAYRTVPFPAGSESDRLLPPAHQVLTPAQLESDDVVVLTAPSVAKELAAHYHVADDDAEGWMTTGAVSEQRPSVQPDAHRSTIGRPRFIAIGQPTRRAAEKYQLDLAATAPTPDADGILRVLSKLATRNTKDFLSVDGTKVPNPFLSH